MTATLPSLLTAGGQTVTAQPIIPVDQLGNFASGVGTQASPNISQPAQNTYQLAPTSPGVTLAAGATVGLTTGIIGGGYFIDVVMSGASPQLVFESLTSDGVNYRQVGPTITASGTYVASLGNNATVRLRNAGTNAITNLSASLT